MALVIKDDSGKEISAYNINAEALFLILQYLQTRPYNEVFTLIDGLRQSIPVYIEPIEPKET